MERQTVLITGGSSGLGLEIAREFLAQGANVGLVARDQQRLEQAKTGLQANISGEQQLSVHSADVTDDQQVNNLIAQMIQHHGQLDALVNNVGCSTRIDINNVSVEDFHDLMEANFYTTVRCTMAALPELKKTSGHVVNIGSLASKTAWPFVSTYAASKHAVANFTNQLRIEGPENIHFLLVCPGPIRRDDAGERYDQQAADLPEAARRPGAGAKIKGLSPHSLARKIVNGCQRRQPEIVMPGKAKVLFILQQISVRMGDWLIRKMSRDK